MYRIITTSLIFLLITSWTVNLKAQHSETDILNQKNDLQKLKKEVKASQKILDSLQQKEVSLTQKVSSYDQRISSDRKIIQRLNREINNIKNDIKKANNRLSQREIERDRIERRYLGSIRQFYFITSQPEIPLDEDPNAELNQQKKIIYLTALAGFERGNINEATKLLSFEQGALTDLSGQSKAVSSLKKKRETSVSLRQSQRRKGQKEIDRLRRKSRVEVDRIMTLKQSAEEMEAIIARLEEAKLRSDHSANTAITKSAFTALKGQLQSPLRGKVVTRFGGSVDKVTKLRSFSPGITIKGRAKNSVQAVASGIVAYAGELRGYGNFIIINHDNQYYSTYAGLGEITLIQDQHVNIRDQVGLTTASGELRFEIRKGREPLDPVKWIRFDSF